MHRGKQSGFTLLELVLVLVVMATILALAAPSLSGWSHGAQLRDAGEQFLAVTRWARAHAISEAQIHRLNVGPAQYQVLIQDGQNFSRISSEFGRTFTVPDNLRLELTDPQGQRLDHLDFLPIGRTQPARVRISTADGESVQLECSAPAEGFVVLAR